MNYKPLKGLRGIQMQADFTRFQFSWDSAGNDSRVHFIWIYKEDELNNPRMFSYAQCIDNRIQVAFQYNNIPKSVFWFFCRKIRELLQEKILPACIRIRDISAKYAAGPGR